MPARNKSVDALSIMEGLLKESSGDDAEAFFSSTSSRQASISDETQDEWQSSNSEGMSLRLLTDGRIGTAATTDLSRKGVLSLPSAARELAHEKWPPARFARPHKTTEDRCDESPLTSDNIRADVDQMKELVRSQSTSLRIRRAEYGVRLERIALATAAGFRGSYSKTEKWCTATIVATSTSRLATGFAVHHSTNLNNVPLEAVVSAACEQALSGLRAQSPSGRKMMTLLDPYATAQLLAILGEAFNGEAVDEGRSWLGSSRDHRVFPSTISICDDGTLPEGLRAAPWDVEGTPSRRTWLVRDGVVTSFLYDLRHARRRGTTSTANAFRSSFKHAVRIAPTNMVFEPLAELGREIPTLKGDVLRVHRFTAVNTDWTAATGRLSLRVSGRLLRDGEDVGSVTRAAIGGSIKDLFDRLIAIDVSDQWFRLGGSFRGDRLLLEDVVVSGDDS